MDISDLLKNEHGEEMLRDVEEEVDLALMRHAGSVDKVGGLSASSGRNDDVDIDVYDGDGHDEDEELLLSLMDHIDDDSVETVEPREGDNTGAMGEDTHTVGDKEFSSFKKGFLNPEKDAVVPKRVMPQVLGDVQERKTSGSTLDVPSGVAEPQEGQGSTTSRPLSKFRRSMAHQR
jgi:hypothetical protein